jgi:hypothetical protein
MLYLIRYPCCFIVMMALGVAGAYAADPAPALDTAKIEQVTGLKGSYSKEESVFTHIVWPAHARCTWLNASSVRSASD